jgi:single-stranded DNA-binding protein
LTRDENVQWVSVAGFGAKAEELAGLEGRLRLNTWTGKDGTLQAGLSVAASPVQRLGWIRAKRPRKSTAAASQSAVNGRADKQPAALEVPFPFLFGCKQSCQGEGNSGCYDVADTAAFAIIPEPSDGPAFSPSP